MAGAALGIGLGRQFAREAGNLAFQEAQANNRAVREAGAEERRQISRAALEQKERAAREYQRTAGTARAAAAGRGVAGGASTQALALSLLADALNNESDINVQEGFDLTASNRRTRAQLVDPNRQRQIARQQGFSAGFGIGSAIGGTVDNLGFNLLAGGR